MKKIIVLILLLGFGLLTNAQSRSDQEWFASVGPNAINNLGSRSPVKSPFDWANGLPFSAAIELYWTTGFAIEQSFTLNIFAEGDIIDGTALTEDLTYTSFDTHLKYYFGRHIFKDATWIDFYANTGIGVFSIQNTNVSFNFGGGILVWFNRRETLGMRLQTIGKFAANHSETVIDNNHFQTHLQLVIHL